MAQGQMKHLADQNGCLDGVIGIRLGSAALCCFCWSPLIDRRLRKPDREVAALAQGIVVLGPVGHLVFWLGEPVAAVLAVFVGHLLFLSMKSIRIMPFQQNGGRFPIYATMPIFHPCRAKPATWHARSPSSPNLAAKARSSRCRKSSSQRP